MLALFWLLPAAVAADTRVPIPGLFNTGVDDLGVVLPLGTVDPHYSMTGPVPSAMAINEYHNWITAPPGSRWIGPSDGGQSDPPGEYIYTLTFDLSGFDPASVNISGQWTSDNGSIIRLNGIETSFSVPPIDPFRYLHSFNLTTGFVEGLNTLEFVVTNNPGSMGNPTGLLVAEIDGDGQASFTLTTNTIGSGAVNKAPDQSSYAWGDTVVVTAVPDPGWVFDVWSGGLSGSQNPDTIVMFNDTTVVAAFVPDTLLVTVTTDPGGFEVRVDSVAYIAPRVFATPFGSVHHLGVDTTVINDDTVHVFSHWSDGEAIEHPVTVLSDTTFIATFDAFYTWPLIDSIVDIPEDQGGWVSIYLTSSWYDSVDSRRPIVGYNVWRRVEDPAIAQLISNEGAKLSRTDIANLRGGVVKKPEWLAGLPLIQWQDQLFASVGKVESQKGVASFPPGTWSIIGSFYATQSEHYIYDSPTHGDSSDVAIPYTVYAVSAHSRIPSVWFMSPPDSGYSIDNIAPGAPEGFAVAYNAGSNHLAWGPSADEDFQYFRIYRSDNPDLTIPDPPVDYNWTVVHSTIETSWTDESDQAWRYRYQITAVDHAGNESDPAFAGAITGITGPAFPKTVSLYQNVPNPFNPTTVIRYDVPAGSGVVSLRIYDVTGALIRTLVDGTVTPGHKSATWDGRDARGNQVSSGIYFYRLVAGSTTLTKKMVLLK